MRRVEMVVDHNGKGRNGGRSQWEEWKLSEKST